MPKMKLIQLLILAVVFFSLPLPIYGEDSRPVSAIKYPPRLPQTGITLALSDLQTLPPAVRPFIRYLWCPKGSDEEYIAATLSLNTAVNVSSFEVCPERIASGSMIRVNFQNYVADSEQLTHQLAVWDSLAWRDPYFSLVDSHHPSDTKNKKGEYDYSKIIMAAPYLKVDFQPGLVYRVDWAVVQMLSAIDGGAYLRFRGLEVGKTTLKDYLRANSADEAGDSVQRAAFRSHITGNVRAVNYFFTGKGRATNGPPLVIITDDLKAGNATEASDFIDTLLDAKADAHEVFLRKANGFWEYTLWQEQKDKYGKNTGVALLIAEAPPDIAHDHNVPRPFLERLQGAISCIRCHNQNIEDNNLLNFHNKPKSMMDGRTRILTDLTHGFSAEGQLRSVNEIIAQYGAPQQDIDSMLNDARLAYFRTVFSATRNLPEKSRVGASEAAQITARIYDSYENAWVSPLDACAEWGFTPMKGDKTGCKTLIAMIPSLEKNGTIPDSSGIAQLQDEWTEFKTDELVTDAITRREFEKVYQIGLIRAMPQIEKIYSNP